MNLKQIKIAFTMNLVCIAMLSARVSEGNLRFIVVDFVVIGYLAFRCFQLIGEIQSSTPKEIE